MKPSITVLEFTKPAKDYEEEMDSAFVEGAPKGKFTKPVMNELVTAFREVQKLMGFEGEDLYPMFEENTVTEFPGRHQGQCRGCQPCRQGSRPCRRPRVRDVLG
jgi:hypothetical protein